MNKRPWLVLVGILAIFAAFIWWPSTASSAMKDAVSYIFSPLFYFSTRVQGSYGFMKSRIQSYTRLQEENIHLQQLNSELRLKLTELHDVEVQNREYREMLDYKERAEFQLVAAKIISRAPANWWQSVVIDRGSADGVQVNSPVLTAQGLVGKVTEVTGENESQVIFLIDNSFEVSVIFQESGQYGIAVGGGPNSLVRITYIDRQAKLKPNDRVFTSGLGGIFPRGIYIGEVQEIIPPQNASQTGLYQEALVKPALEFSRIENVFVNLGKAGKAKPSTGAGKKKRK